MAGMLHNFVLETSSAPGTSATINLNGAASGRMSFASSFSTGATVYYFMDDGTQAEWGSGTFTIATPNTLSRSTVIGNTSGTTARLNFAGTTRVYNEVPGERAVYLDGSGNLSLPGNVTLSGFVDISGSDTGLQIDHSANISQNLNVNGTLTCGSGGSFASSLAGPSWSYRLPGGLIVQGGLATVTPPAIISFPITLGTVLSLRATRISTVPSDTCTVAFRDLSSFTLYATGSSASVYWEALGT